MNYLAGLRFQKNYQASFRTEVSGLDTLVRQAVSGETGEFETGRTFLDTPLGFRVMKK